MFANVNEDLTGLSPIDWKRANELYGIEGYKGQELKILPRDDVMLSLVTMPECPQENVELEQICKALTGNEGNGADELRALAKQYIVLKNKDARIPKFGKWVASMFKERQDFMTLMAKMGQQAVPAQNIIISCNPVDLLRGGIGKHFNTCLGPIGNGGWAAYGYHEIIPAVLQECPGVAVAFINSGDKYNSMIARCWIHHIEVKGKTAIQMNHPYGNGITEKSLAKVIAAKGYDVYNQTYGGATKYKFINNFERPIHWDALETVAQGDLIAAAAGERVVVKKPINKKAA